MKTFFCCIFLLSACALAQTTKADRDYINNTLYPATALLYAQDESGTMKMRCTATAIDKDEAGYVFVTAAHCACEDNTDKNEVRAEKTYFFITADESGSKSFLKAAPTACGYRHRGDDFALFQVDTKDAFPVIPLGNDPKILDQIVNVASPLGLGKQVFLGSTSSSTLNRPVVVEDINWTNAVLLQLFGVNGGSSGSAVVCLDQKAICSFVVGSIENTTMVAMPVSRLLKLRADLKANAYKYWKTDDDTPSEKKKK